MAWRINRHFRRRCWCFIVLTVKRTAAAMTGIGQPITGNGHDAHSAFDECSGFYSFQFLLSDRLAQRRWVVEILHDGLDVNSNAGDDCDHSD